MDGVEVVRRQPFGDNPSVGARGASTQRTILAAAVGVFAEHGFHDTRVELITEAAGCSRPSFYQYFSSKEDVFWRLARHLARELRDVVDRLDELTPDLDGVASLETWLGELVDLYQAYQPVFVSFREAFREDGPPEQLPRTITTHLRDLLEATAVLPGGSAAELDLDALAEATTATLLRSIHYWLLGLEPMPRPRFTRGVASTVHRVFFGPMDGVNTGRLADPPPKWVPEWPTETGESAPPLRPRGRATRQRLLDAGGRVLPVRGYHETRVDDIVTEAGLSHGSFYRYFENKDELFGVLAFDAVEHMVHLVEEFPDDPADTLETWLGEWFECYRSKGGVLSAWEEIGFGAPDVVARSTEIAEVFLDRLERVVCRRGFGDISVDTLVLLAVIEHGPHSVLVLDRLEEPRAIATVGYIIRRGVLGRDEFE